VVAGKLDGRVALITGMATGIGRAGAELFAAEGAAVVGLDVNEGVGTTVVDGITTSGGRATFLAGDVANGADVQRAVDAALHHYGGLDLLWGNAGIGVFKNVVDTTEDEWDRIVAINLKGAYLLAHLGLPHLVAAGGGTVVFTASVNSYVADTDWAAYCATKGGVLMLTKAIALDHAKDNVRANCVCPGSVDTPLLDAAFAVRASDPAAAAAADVAQHPIGRIAQPIEIARAALYLSCDDSSYVTGTALVADGGFTAL
jgi:NAD(P)-dependent dehydrogenase (short-subunit alcohol dehydrogenase family)